MAPSATSIDLRGRVARIIDEVAFGNLKLGDLREAAQYRAYIRADSVIAEIRADSLESFNEVISRIRTVESIARTETSLLLSTHKL